MRWRTGRKVGRTIYEQHGPEPSDNDRLIGLMDTPGLADMVVRSLNAYAAVRRALDDELANLADDGARLSHSVVRRIEAALEVRDG